MAALGGAGQRKTRHSSAAGRGAAGPGRAGRGEVRHSSEARSGMDINSFNVGYFTLGG